MIMVPVMKELNLSISNFNSPLFLSNGMDSLLFLSSELDSLLSLSSEKDLMGIESDLKLMKSS